MGLDYILVRFITGFAITLVFGVIAFMREMVDDTGFFAGVIIFTLIYVFLDWQAYAILIVFFLMTGFAIDLENKYKTVRGEFELYKAKRSMERVLGRSMAGAVFAALFFATYRFDFKLAFVASYAEAIFDTISTKLGKLLSPKAVMITNLKPVRHGTPGAVSWQGTLFGILAASILGVTGAAVRLIGVRTLFIVIIAAFLGSMIDSFLNAYSYQKRRMSNEFINFFSSIMAGLVCMFAAWFLKIVVGVRI